VLDKFVDHVVEEELDVELRVELTDVIRERLTETRDARVGVGQRAPQLSQFTPLLCHLQSGTADPLQHSPMNQTHLFTQTLPRLTQQTLVSGSRH